MKPSLSRRSFCAGTALLPAATLWLPGCGGGGSTDASEQPTAGPLRAGGRIRAHASGPTSRARSGLAAAPGLPPNDEARSLAMAVLAGA